MAPDQTSDFKFYPITPNWILGSGLNLIPETCHTPVNKAELPQAPGLGFSLPREYASLPRLSGASHVT